MRKYFFVAILLCVLIAFAAIWYARRSTTPGQQTAAGTSGTPSTTLNTGTDQHSRTPITGTSPKPNVPANASAPKASGTEKTTDKNENATNDPFEYGHFPRVPRDANENTKSAFEASVSHSHPERLSVMLNGKPFDNEAFKQNPKAYLDVVEPGRVFQTAQPGEDVPRIKPLVKEQQTLSQGEKIELKVKAAPLTLVTFTTFDGGRFENLLSSMSVQANEQGIASVHYEATSGVIANVNILAASPSTSGQVRFGAYVSKATR